MKQSNEGTLTMKERIERLTSQDGTPIEYRVLGHGPALVVVHGGNTAAQHFLPLASSLANDYTVSVMNRRGRNGSGPQGEDYSLQKECEDAIALLDKMQASFLFGHSYGGLIALGVACHYPLAKMALYEPAVSVNASVPIAWLPDFERLLENKKYLGAQVSVLKGARLVGNARFLPNLIFEQVLRSFLKGEQLEEMSKLLPTLPKEWREVIKLDSTSDQYARVTAETLLLAGTKSPAFIHQAIQTLESVLPHSQTRVFPGLDHSAPVAAPEKIAQALKDFFGEHVFSQERSTQKERMQDSNR